MFADVNMQTWKDFHDVHSCLINLFRIFFSWFWQQLVFFFLIFVKLLRKFHALPDGRKKFPINHGATSADTILKVCGAISLFCNLYLGEFVNTEYYLQYGYN